MIGYLDLPSGLSGDMFLGCLVDAGWPIERLRETVAALKLPGNRWSVEARQVRKGALAATLVDVKVIEGHPQRHLGDIRAIIDASPLPAGVKERSVAVFTRLAIAEAKVHAMPVEEVHFHEVGALDTIVDIVGSVAGLSELGIEKLYASGVPLGQGWTPTLHGKMPLPAPATLELLSAVGAPTRPAPGPGEWVTPTGAALLGEFATFRQPVMTLKRIAMGAGQRDCAWPNVARLWLGEESVPASGGLVQLETNIDDMNPQLYAPVSEKLFAAGALDVWLTPVQMKKGRPAVVLSVICPAAVEQAVCDLILRETTTLGIRVLPIARRHEAGREMRQVATPYGTVAVKLKLIGGEAVAAMPEFADCAALAEKAEVPVRQVYEAALASAVRRTGDV